MELTIDFVKELTNRAEEIGKLKEQIKQKDMIISGLTAQLGQAHTCKCGNTTKEEKVESPQILQQADTPRVPLNDVVYTEQEVVAEPIEKVGQPKVKRKYTKRAESWNTKKTAQVVNKVQQPGGTVFKSFEPLELNKIVVEGANTSAYVPTDKRLFNDKIAAISAGLGSSSKL